MGLPADVFDDLKQQAVAANVAKHVDINSSPLCAKLLVCDQVQGSLKSAVHVASCPEVLSSMAAGNGSSPVLAVSHVGAASASKSSSWWACRQAIFAEWLQAPDHPIGSNKGVQSVAAVEDADTDMTSDIAFVPDPMPNHDLLMAFRSEMEYYESQDVVQSVPAGNTDTDMTTAIASVNDPFNLSVADLVSNRLLAGSQGSVPHQQKVRQNTSTVIDGKDCKAQ